MKFIIRDDDLNYFSQPSDIERWYADIFAKGIPVGFSAIPFVKTISDVYTANAAKEDAERPISGNEELIEYVKGNPLVEILQHGTTHETKNKVFEYQAEVSLGEAKRGREELERAFGTSVDIFVPPHDWINSSGILAVEAAHMNIIRGRGAGLRNYILRWEYLRTFIMVLCFRFAHAFDKKVPVYPHVLDFGLHKEACSYRLEDEDVFSGLEYANRERGILVIVTHLHFYTPEKKQRLLRVIARAKELDADFVAPSALFK